MTFIESKALGKEQEEQDLFREMQSDIVLQVHAAPVGHPTLELSHAAARRPACRACCSAA